MKLRGIEAARGFAALLVVLRHATAIMAPAAGALPFAGLFLFGRAGVEFFFVLSGFIMMFVHAGDVGVPRRWPGFWRKRLLRIYPAYWAATLLFLLLLLLSPTKDRAEQEPLHILLSVLLLPETRWPILDVGWSLRHELLFYLVFGVLLLNRRAGAVLLAGWAAGIAVQVVSLGAAGAPAFPGMLGEFVFAPFNLEFFWGIGVALLLRRRAVAAVPCLLAGVGLFLGCGMLESFTGLVVPGGWAGVLAYGAGSALMLYGAAQLDLGRRWRVPGPLVALGGASYSVYLTHVMVLIVVGQVFKRSPVHVPGEVALLVGVVAAVTFGVGFSRLVEQPMLRWGRGRPAVAA